MSKIQDDAVRRQVASMLDAVETAIVGFSKIFNEVARGEPLDSQRAENLAAQCTQLIETIGDTRNTIRLSGDSPGVH